MDASKNVSCVLGGSAALALCYLLRKRFQAVQLEDSIKDSLPVTRDIGTIHTEGIPEFPKAFRERVQAYRQGRGAGFAGWGDGYILISTRFSETPQVHRVVAPLNYREQLTFFHEPVASVRICPDKSRPGFLFLKDTGGNEYHQVYWFCLRSASVTLLTDGSSKNSGIQWSRCGALFAYASTRRNGKDWDIYCQRMAPSGASPPLSGEGEEEQVGEGEERLLLRTSCPGWQPLEWDADGSRLLVKRYVSASESHLYLLTTTHASATATVTATATAPATAIEGAVEAAAGGVPGAVPGDGCSIALLLGRVSQGREGRVSYSHCHWLRRNALVLVSDDASQFRSLRLAQLGSSGSSTDAAASDAAAAPTVSAQCGCLTADIPWDVCGVAVAPDGGAVAVVMNEGGSSSLYLFFLPPPLPDDATDADATDADAAAATDADAAAATDADAAEGAPVRRRVCGLCQGVRRVRVPGLPLGVISGAAFSPDGCSLGFSLNSPISPSDVFSLDVAAFDSSAAPNTTAGTAPPDTAIRRWTQAEVGGLQPQQLSLPSLIHYPTFDNCDGTVPPSPPSQQQETQQQQQSPQQQQQSPQQQQQSPQGGAAPCGRRHIPSWLYLPPPSPSSPNTSAEPTAVAIPPAADAEAKVDAAAAAATSTTTPATPAAATAAATAAASTNAGGPPLPVVILIHGGPESQSRPTFRSLVQFLACELRCAVLLPNVRGSAGYGKAYVCLDDGRNREHSVADIGALLDWIAARPHLLDSRRVAVWGGSYGGYMVLASLIRYGPRLVAGAECVGISNFVTFLQNTKPYRRDLRRQKYGDERDEDMRRFLNAISPLTNAHRIHCPLLVAQGANDPRVPASESVQICDAVRANGGEVWYMIAGDEGHGFKRKSNRDYYLTAVAFFLAKHLGIDLGSLGQPLSPK